MNLWPLFRRKPQSLDDLFLAKHWQELSEFRSPIDSRRIPNFASWINFNGYCKEDHSALDLIAYLTKKGELVIGLPKGTKVRAVADGCVYGVESGLLHSERFSKVQISHSKQIDRYHHTSNCPRYRHGIKATYVHLIPQVREGELVKAGQVIGELYFDEEQGTYPSHLHLELLDCDWKTVDPRLLYRGVKFVEPLTPFTLDFSEPSLQGAPIVVNTDSGYINGASFGRTFIM